MADITVLCPLCSGRSLVKKEWRRKGIRCPNCSQLFTLPEFEQSAESSRSAASGNINFPVKSVVKLLFFALLIAGGVWLYFKWTAPTPESIGGNELSIMTRKRANRDGAGGIMEIARADLFPIINSKKNFFYRNAVFKYLSVTRKDYEVFSGTIAFMRKDKMMERPVIVDRRNSFSTYRLPFKYSENDKFLLEDADLIFELATVIDKSLKEWKFESASVAGKGVLACNISKNGSEKRIVYLEAEQVSCKDNIGRIWVKILPEPPAS
jgi:hypothetical protein